MAPFFTLICISDQHLSLTRFCMRYVFGKSVMKETCWSGCSKYSGSKMFTAVLSLAFFKNKKKKYVFQRGKQVCSLSYVLFSLIKWLEHDALCYELSANFHVRLFSHKVHNFHKHSLQYVLAAYWVMGFDCILSIVNKTTETCIILPDNIGAEGPVQGIKYQRFVCLFVQLYW